MYRNFFLFAGTYVPSRPLSLEKFEITVSKQILLLLYLRKPILMLICFLSNRSKSFNKCWWASITTIAMFTSTLTCTDTFLLYFTWYTRQLLRWQPKSQNFQSSELRQSVPKAISLCKLFPWYNIKFRGKRDTTVHELFLVVSRFPRYISCNIA